MFFELEEGAAERDKACFVADSEDFEAA